MPPPPLPPPPPQPPPWQFTMIGPPPPPPPPHEGPLQVGAGVEFFWLTFPNFWIFFGPGHAGGNDGWHTGWGHEQLWIYFFTVNFVSSLTLRHHHRLHQTEIQVPVPDKPMWGKQAVRGIWMDATFFTGNLSQKKWGLKFKRKWGLKFFEFCAVHRSRNRQ